MTVLIEVIAIVTADAVGGADIGVTVWRKVTGKSKGCGCGYDCSGCHGCNGAGKKTCGGKREEKK